MYDAAPKVFISKSPVSPIFGCKANCGNKTLSLCDIYYASYYTCSWLSDTGKGKVAKNFQSKGTVSKVQ